MGIHSQNGEDGILLFVFSVVGTTDRRFVEFGMGDGRVCNTANLTRNWGWGGLLLDADHRLTESGAGGPMMNGSVWMQDSSESATLVTADNINPVFREEGLGGSIDLLSIDIDGNDYWVWKSLDVLLPRVVVIEYNASFGPERSVTIPYDPRFDRYEVDVSGIYHGASLTALTRLGREKGYHSTGL